MKIKAIKFIVIGVFFFSLIYMNKDKIPMPEELKTFDFIISGGIDIDIDLDSDKEDKFSISYISSEETEDKDNKSNANKNIFNIKAGTMNETIEKIQNLTNKSLNDSHLEYILIGEKTVENHLDYLVDYYSRSNTIRFDVKSFVIKDMTSEDFIKKILTSEINTDARLDGIANNKNQLSSMTNKTLKDITQIFYSKEKTGFIPVLAIKESPIKNADDENSDNKYTFEFYGLGLLKDGKLKEYLPYSLVRSYLILTGTLKTTDIEITDENNNLYVFTVKNSKSKTSFEFDKNNTSLQVFELEFKKRIQTESKK